jgi:DNA-binding NarL/FixJ family response regulator
LSTPATQNHMHSKNRRGGKLNRARVMLADDNELVVRKVTALLALVFDVVGIARTGEEMVSEATRLDPDVIIADITMPVFTGIEAARRIREAGLRARVVFLTIHKEEEFVEACFQEGALGYVVKTQLKADLIPAINAAIAGESFISPALAP